VFPSSVVPKLTIVLFPLAWHFAPSDQLDFLRENLSQPSAQLSTLQQFHRNDRMIERILFASE
jgi:hypothetical protein